MIRARDIIPMVCADYGITESDLLGPCRRDKFALPRQVAYWLTYHTTGLSYVKTGWEFERHHTTILSGVRRIEKLIENDVFAGRVARFLDRIRRAA